MPPVSGLVEPTLTGWTRVRHLENVAHTLPECRAVAAQEAAEYMQAHMWDVAQVRRMYAEAEHPSADLEAWCAATAENARSESERLEAELGACLTHRLQEGARCAHLAMAQHDRKCGKLDDALAHYECAREFGTTNEHALTSYIGAIQTAHEAGAAARVAASYDQAETLLHALKRTYSPTAEVWAAIAHAALPGVRAVTFDEIQARLAACRLVAQWTQSHLQDMPHPLLDAKHLPAFHDLVGPTQCAWYAVLWALCARPPHVQRARATFILNDAAFEEYASANDAPRAALRTYLESAWVPCLDIVRSACTFWACDPALGTQRAQALRDTVTVRLLECYVQAYARVPLTSVAQVFGAQVPRMLMELVSDGVVHARIDWAQQVLEHEPHDDCVNVRHLENMCALRARMTLVQRISMSMNR